MTGTENLSDESLQCRDLRHAWSVIRQTLHDRKVLVRVLECARCGTTRVDDFSWPTLAVLARKYYYPDAYLAKPSGRKGQRTSLQDLRFEWYRRHGVAES